MTKTYQKTINKKKRMKVEEVSANPQEENNRKVGMHHWDWGGLSLSEEG